MVQKSLRKCSYPACKLLVRSRFCEKHANEDREKLEAKCKERKKPRTEYKDARGKNIYGWKWQKARSSFLTDNPFCGHCLLLEPKQYTQAVIVDHIRPHKGDLDIFWDASNWQGLCKKHHDIKTCSIDGGFGNKVKYNGK